jgi:polyisoprenoid-binding protein YceI
MKLKLFALALAGVLVLPHAAAAATYQIDTTHSSVEFSIRHLVAKTSGRFNDFTGTIEFDDQHPEKGSVSVSIKAASINTDNEDRDGHLRSPDFFDTEKYPEITFTGTVAEKTDDGFNVAGVLTMHGVAKDIVMPVEYLGTGPGMRGETRSGFYTEIKLNRKEYGIEWNKQLDQGGLILGDEVTIRISIEAVISPGQAQK